MTDNSPPRRAIRSLRARLKQARQRMRSDARVIALRFNECINRQDIDALAQLMTEDHTFIDREGTIHRPRDVMVESWRKFFQMYPDYRNTFNRVELKDNMVVILGSAYWSEKEPHDPAIWTVTVEDNLVQEWRVYADTTANRRAFDLA